jgi:hypothetical protein
MRAARRRVLLRNKRADTTELLRTTLTSDTVIVNNKTTEVGKLTRELLLLLGWRAMVAMSDEERFQGYE